MFNSPKLGCGLRTLRFVWSTDPCHCIPDFLWWGYKVDLERSAFIFPALFHQACTKPLLQPLNRLAQQWSMRKNINPSNSVVLWTRQGYDASHHRDAPFTGRRLEENKLYAEIMAAVKSVSIIWFSSLPSCNGGVTYGARAGSWLYLQ